MYIFLKIVLLELNEPVCIPQASLGHKIPGKEQPGSITMPDTAKDMKLNHKCPFKQTKVLKCGDIFSSL